jgi:homoserine O-succinyltransferase/O-acetyltransferase
MFNTKKIKVAILDLNNNTPNRGITYLKKIVGNYTQFQFDVFDVRYKNEIPDLKYDIYLSSGGPGSPFDMEGGWNIPYFELIDKINHHNEVANSKPKFVFFICHSFQLSCIHFKIGELGEREKMSFGVFPIYKTFEGEYEPLLEGLESPFWIADFRFWQVINPDKLYLEEKGYKILAYEQLNNNHTKYKAIMAIRYNDFMVGTQFHPEADADGMFNYFNTQEKKEQIVKDFGAEAYQKMMTDIQDDEKIDKTFKTILPNFLDNCISKLIDEKVSI